jgi:hypothetical protein
MDKFVVRNGQLNRSHQAAESKASSASEEDEEEEEQEEEEEEDESQFGADSEESKARQLQNDKTVQVCFFLLFLFVSLFLTFFFPFLFCRLYSDNVGNVGILQEKQGIHAFGGRSRC